MTARAWYFGGTDPVPMATGNSSPVWPLPAVTRRRWTFGASRDSGARHHTGVDLYAPRGSVVLAPEGGELIARQRFNGPNAIALLMETDSGPVILFGEIEPGSWKEFGLEIGSRVEAGAPVARVGINPGGSQMLHFEMYDGGTRQNARWMASGSPPSNLLDPTAYLQAAKALDTGQSDPSIKDDVDPAEDPKHIDDPPGDITDTPGTLPTTPGGESPWGGLVQVALIFGALTLLDDWDG